MKQYIDLANKVLTEGSKRMERTGTGTIAIFGPQLEFDLRKGFPAVTTKKLNIRLVWSELLWMISGESSIRPLLEDNNNIWNDWPFKKWIERNNITIKNEAERLIHLDYFKSQIMKDRDFEKEYGDLGPVYGVQWRHFKKAHNGWVDQLQNAIDTINNNPTDRRILVTAWNPGEIDKMALPPCHLMYQLYVDGDELDIKVYQRSADVFLGLPFDIASYATLASMIGYITGKTPRMMYYGLGDTHIYLNHVDQVKEMISRPPYPLPTLEINVDDREILTIDDFMLSDFKLHNYEHHEAIKGEVSV